MDGWMDGWMDDRLINWFTESVWLFNYQTCSNIQTVGCRGSHAVKASKVTKCRFM